MRYRPYRGKRAARSPFPFFIMIPLLLCAAALAVLVLGSTPDKPPAVQDDPSSTPAASVSPSRIPIAASPAPTPAEPVELPWNLTLVNAAHPLPEDFTVVTKALKSGKSFDSRAFDALVKMLSDCQAAGLQPLVCSAYRNADDQASLFQEQLDRLLASGLSYDEAYAAASSEIAVPGTSEHSLGLAADICALSYQVLDAAQADTAEQQWLMAHCAEYGFILRYPKDKEYITGIIYEPWHYRYVGEEAAKAITESGLCLEEYLIQKYGVE